MPKMRTNRGATERRINRYVQGRDREGLEARLDIIEMYRTMEQDKRKQEQDPEWRKNNLEYDLRTSKLIAKKCKDESYAQNLYAALCNMRWQKREVMPILKDEYWSCSWRYAGGLIADILEKGDYMDWYCSGIAGGDEPDVYEAGHDLNRKGFVPEGQVTDEIRADLADLGWQPMEWEDRM